MDACGNSVRWKCVIVVGVAVQHVARRRRVADTITKVARQPVSDTMIR